MKFQRKVLENGLRIITVPDKNSLAATCLVLVEAGSKYETKQINGVSHFLEHMCFKGTTKRPKALDITSELDSLGAQYNAFTAQEYTGYYAKVRAEKLDQALDIVSDIYLNQIFDPAEIEKEKGVIVEEINMYEDMPQRKVQDLIMKVLYGDQPAGWNVAGEKDIVRSLTRDNFIDYHSKHYVASGTTVVVAGNFDETITVEKIEKLFSDISAKEKHCKPETKENQQLPQAEIFFKESDQSHLVLAFRTCNIFDERYYALEVLSGVLGGGMSSRLFQRIREQMGAAYYIGSRHDAYTDHGYLEISAGADNKRTKEVVSAVLEEVARLKNDAIGDKELQTAKDYLIGNMFLNLETSDSIASFFGGQEVLRQPMMNPNDVAAKMQAVTSEDLLAVANQFIKNDRLNFALVGPYKNSGDFSDVLSVL
ncbi:MAG: pitrilysin family protein [Candidatus Paceibacterota bacterium]|jgi:predicted Zn-dependent peptidase